MVGGRGTSAELWVPLSSFRWAIGSQAAGGNHAFADQRRDGAAEIISEIFAQDRLFDRCCAGGIAVFCSSCGRPGLAGQRR